MVLLIIDRARAFCKIGILLRRGLSPSPLVGRWCVDDVKNHAKSTRTLYTKGPADGPQAGQEVQNHFAGLPALRHFHSEDYSFISLWLISSCMVWTLFQDIFHCIFRLLDSGGLWPLLCIAGPRLAARAHGEVVALDGKSVQYVFDPTRG
jgi:hypothetical protein